MAYLQVFPNFIFTELPEVDSTNLYTEKLLLINDLPEGSVIYTFNQIAGIGQADNKWESEPFKNLTSTIILKPVFLEAKSQFLLTTVLSLSVCDTLSEYMPDVVPAIKWPNDIYCNNRKIAGILIKNQIMGKSISVSIAGLGLNINQTEFVTAHMATSIKLITGKDHDIREIMTKWHSIVSDYYFQLKTDKKALVEKYLIKLYLKDQKAVYRILGKQITATITGVDKHGQLVLFDDAGKRYVCGLKEIVFPFLG